MASDEHAHRLDQKDSAHSSDEHSSTEPDHLARRAQVGVTHPDLQARTGTLGKNNPRNPAADLACEMNRGQPHNSEPRLECPTHADSVEQVRAGIHSVMSLPAVASSENAGVGGGG